VCGVVCENSILASTNEVADSDSHLIISTCTLSWRPSHGTAFRLRPQLGNFDDGQISLSNLCPQRRTVAPASTSLPMIHDGYAASTSSIFSPSLHFHFHFHTHFAIHQTTHSFRVLDVYEHLLWTHLDICLEPRQPFKAA